MTGLLLLLAPPLALALALLLGHRPGEQAIERLRTRLAPAPRPRRRPVTAVPQLPRAPLLPRGGRLVAAAVAARPPPTG